MAGRLTADLAIDGTLAAPLVNGPILLENGRYENDLAGTDLRDLAMKITASNTRIVIEQFAGKAGKDGTLAADGWLELDPAAHLPLSVTLRLNNAGLVDRDDAKAWISGDITMSGDMADAIIESKLRVERAEISIPDGGGPNLPALEVEEVGGNIVNPEKKDATTRAERPFDPELNMQIKAPNKVYVRGRGLESEWLGDLEISGRTSDPRILGNLKIKKGYFDFLEKRFELALGEITFAGASPPNPIIAIEAVAEDNDFKAIIKLNGPATDPKLTLDSEPALPEDEILARLLFNRDLSEIGPIEAGKLALALNRLRGGGGFDAFGEIRNALNIDTLDVVSGESAADSRVKAGKYLNDDVYVEVEKGAGDQSGRARVEVEILPSISLEADTGEDATSGVGLKWKFNY
jgi:translocation and assembly module TamB